MKSTEPALARLCLLAALCLSMISLNSCTGRAWQAALAGSSTMVSYDDLGTEAMLLPVLGPRGTDPRILVHLGATTAHSQPRRLSAYNGMLMLRRNEANLPHNAANDLLRQRMRRAYSQIHHYYRTRRDAALAAPPYFGRGAMGRNHMMPPIPSSL